MFLEAPSGPAQLTSRNCDLQLIKKVPKKNRGPVTECTKPSDSQSLAHLIVNLHSQGISAAMMKNVAISFAKKSHSPLANAFATLNLLSFFVLIWFRQFPSKFAGRVKTRIRIRSCIAVTVARSGPEGGTNGPIKGTYRAPAKVWPLFHCTKPSFNCTLASYGSNCRGSRKSLKRPNL